MREFCFCDQAYGGDLPEELEGELDGEYDATEKPDEEAVGAVNLLNSSNTACVHRLFFISTGKHKFGCQIKSIFFKITLGLIS